MGDKSYWDQKFKQRGNKPLGPDPMLVDHLHLLKRGRLLDLACGDGRNSLYLDEKGFEVTGLDFSDQALKRLESFSNGIMTYQRDLTLASALDGLGIYDTIVINHYRLPSDLINKLPDLLSSQGTLFVSGFSDKHTPDGKITVEDLLRIEDFKGLEGRMSLMKTLETKDARGDFITYIFVLND
ncbi:bifunctional 2-polyprenyl-6-hydroxyphenol methylase/3-demethylubiquinol 3-O-methyltransferase UbiG [Acidaminobacter sp. JC074]|uniref:class I SAM-dependent methyltransferase n=1 Tax=Acidaminobacter sp. JC074 TaxID=2530199 RepID=UPI001F0F0B83|nr:methyltransferase domain-containing protein [Acidaminobacter sp. JC074]